MSKHTKGPWSHRNGRIFQTDHEALTIANVARAYDGDYSQSNGDLLAAAPELLEALIEVTASLAWNAHGECRAIHDGPIMPSAQAVEFALAAIAKAKGEK